MILVDPFSLLYLHFQLRWCSYGFERVRFEVALMVEDDAHALELELVELTGV